MTCSRVWLWMEGWKFKILLRGRKRIVDGTVRSLIPFESRELLAASYLLRSIELLLHLLSRPPPSSFHFCSFSSHFSSRYLSSFDLLFHSYTPRLVGAVLVFKDLITDSSLILSRGTAPRHLGLHLSSYSTFFLSNLASHAFSSSSFSSSSSCLLARSPIDKGMRPSPFSTQEKREQRGKEV